MIDDDGDGGDGDGDGDGTVDAGSSVKEGLYPPPSSLTTLDATNEENDGDDEEGSGGEGESDGDGGSSTNSSTRADGREQSLLLLQSSNCWCVVLSSALVAHVGAAPPTLAER